MTSRACTLAALALTLACGKGAPKPGTGSSAGASTAGAGSAVNSAATNGSAVDSGAGAGTAAGSAAAIGAIDPKVTAARCGEPCLFLIDTPLDKLGETVKTACAGAEFKELDYTDCHRLDYFRNCIFAAHGFAFEKKNWQATFKDKPWYTVRPEFKPTMITAAERATVTDLNDRAKTCKYSGVTPADHKLVQAWFAALPKAPAPPRGMIESEQAKGEAVVKQIARDLSGPNMTAYKREQHLGMRYASADETDPGPLTADDVGAPADAKIRTVVVDIASDAVGTEDNPLTSGVYIRFALDDKNTLLAIAVSEYLYD